MTYDLIVIGGGLAGLTAAVRASELGLKTIVLEQGNQSQYPCNSRESGGILHIGFHDPCREPDELKELISRLTENHARPDVASALATNASRFLAWLGRKDVRFMRFDPREMYRWCMAPPRALRGGIDWEGRGPDRALSKLTEALVSLGGTLMLNSQATDLVMENKHCIGVRGKVAGKETVWGARNCVIADGGFQSDRELVERHIAPDFDALFQRGAGTSRGDGLKMAVAAGASLTDMNRFYGHLLCADARFNDGLWPFPQLDAVATAGIVINGDGARVADEGRSGVYLTNALASVPADRGLFAIFDSAIWQGPGKSDRVSPNPWIEKAGGTVYRADTLEALAQLIGAPPAELTRTVDQYHRAMHAGTLRELPVPRSEKIKPCRIEAAPYMAISLIPGITYTMGGIAIDEAARVLGKDGRPIPGLFAAGASTGGIEGGNAAGYIGGLIKAGTFGLIAAEHAAERLDKRAPTIESQGASTGMKMHSPSTLSAPPKPQGLDRYPLIRATLRHGQRAAYAIGATAFVSSASLAWNSLGFASLLIATACAVALSFAILSYTELLRFITELLMPE